MNDLSERFFGRGIPSPGGPTVANPRLLDPPAFQLLFTSPLDLDADALTLALRDYHADLAPAVAELLHVPREITQGNSSDSPVVMGLVGWGRHAIKVVGFNAPMSQATVEACIQPSHYEPQLKQLAYQHAAHVLLFYAGYESDLLEQHVALAVVAAALAQLGAIVVMNEVAHTSVPAVSLLPHEEDAGDTLRAMRELPLPFLYAGFVKLELDDEPGIWLRTYGCHVFRLPDLAFKAESHSQSTALFALFSNMLDYLRNSRQSFAVGDTMGVGNGQFFRFRARTPAEWFLESPGEMLVIEPVAEGEQAPASD